MQLHHDPSTDPMSVTSHERERQRIADATAAFLARGGQVQQLGHAMQSTSPTFVINPKTTPLFAHLFSAPEQPLKAKSEQKPSVPAKPEMEVEQQQQAEQHQVVMKGRRPGMTHAQLGARLLAQAALGASPSAAARAVGITEKQARQLARELRITFKRQR